MFQRKSHGRVLFTDNTAILCSLNSHALKANRPTDVEAEDWRKSLSLAGVLKLAVLVPDKGSFIFKLCRRLGWGRELLLLTCEYLAALSCRTHMLSVNTA